MRTAGAEGECAGALLLPCFLIAGRWSLVADNSLRAAGLVPSVHEPLYRHNYQLSIDMYEVYHTSLEMSPFLAR